MKDREEQEGFWMFAGLGVAFLCIALGVGSCSLMMSIGDSYNKPPQAEAKP